MAKYVIFSFDDGRQDTYTNAFEILQKYGFAATLNITTDFVNNPQNYTNFRSAGNRSMGWEEIAQLQEAGWEIANHSHTHSNEVEDIKKSFEELENHGIHTDEIGFASPNSAVDRNNYSSLKESLPAGIFYVRSGLRTRREGLVYAGLTFLNRWLKSRKLFCLLNSRCKLKLSPELIKAPMLSLGITSDMSVKSVVALLETLTENEGYILMFHSILSEKEDLLKVDSWWWGTEKFEGLCRWLADQKDYQVLTTKQFVKRSLQIN